MLPPNALESNRSIALEVIEIHSNMLLPLMNPLCSPKMILGAMVDSLSAKISMMIFHWKLAKAMGLNYSILSP